MNNINNKSLDAELFGVEIRKNVKHKFLSITDLQLSYKNARHQYGWVERRIDSVTQQNEFKNQVYKLLKSKKIISCDLNEFFNSVNDMGIIKFLKRLGLYKTEGRGIDKNAMCVDYVWRLIYHKLFKESMLVNIPKFITDIDLPTEYVLTSSGRDDSMESSFINKFLASCNLISENIETQFKVGSYKYDLKLELLGKPYIIEYHEKQHIKSTQIEIDRDKFNKVKDNFAYIVIPFKKEQEQLSYIKECLTNNYDIGFINELEEYRYSNFEEMNTSIKSILPNPDYSKFAIAINQKVFGQHITGMRNLASAKELRKIADIEKFVINAIEQKWVHSEEQILKAIENYK